jgi:two-component system response regulator MprA
MGLLHWFPPSQASTRNPLARSCQRVPIRYCWTEDMGTRTMNQQVAKVLVAEDDTEIRTALERILRYEGYEPITVNDGAAALEAITEHEPDLIVLDVMMPFVDGLTVCRRIRERGNRTPVLMLTARVEVSDRVAGLDAGADDYLPKPFDLEELLARIRALLRRVLPDDSELLTAGDLSLDPQRHEVTMDGARIELTRTEFEILALLLRNVGIVLERGVMYERIWGYDFDGESRSLDVHVGYLRRKLEASGADRMIETVRGIGFVLRP